MYPTGAMVEERDQLEPENQCRNEIDKYSLCPAIDLVDVILRSPLPLTLAEFAF